MYAVIFKAKIKTLDNDYSQTAQRMRQLAMDDYGCLDFISACEDSDEGGNELAISYWPNKESIKAWKNNREHIEAQQKGRSLWYESYEVQVVEVLHQYDHSHNQLSAKPIP